MLRRAAISVLILLTGGGGAMAGTLDPSLRNQQFQPGKAKNISMLRPVQARALGGEVRYSGVSVKQVTPILLAAPTRVEVGKTAFSKPADAAVHPAVTKAAGK
jgi:hypothetical protein